MQSTKNATQQLNKPRRADKLIIGGPSTIKIRRRPRILFCAKRSARPAQRPRPTFIVGHTVTTIYYESIGLCPFTNITFGISTLKNRPTFNLSY